jgi:DNA-binding GntR family transcriptional regulator
MNTELYAEIAREVIRTCQQQAMPLGALIGEQTFAKRLGVSRAPVRRALAILESQGIVEQKPGVGYLLRKNDFDNVSLLLSNNGGDEQGLITELMADRAHGSLAQEVSENELIVRYNSSRGAVRKALQRLAAENLVFRQRGHGWKFVDSLDNEQAISESYAFRIEVECGALRQKAYKVDPNQLKALRAQHIGFIEKEPSQVTREEWFWINANFHEAIGAWSGNRFFHQAIKQQNSLRRMHQYADFASLSNDEVQISCKQHLDIMDALREGKLTLAEDLLRKHLSDAI